jgi:hypothetical protein
MWIGQSKLSSLSTYSNNLLATPSNCTMNNNERYYACRIFINFNYEKQLLTFYSNHSKSFKDSSLRTHGNHARTQMKTVIKTSKSKKQNILSQLNRICECLSFDYCEREYFNIRSSLLPKLKSETFENLTTKLQTFYSDKQNQAKISAPTTFFDCDFISPEDAANSHIECHTYCDSEETFQIINTKLNNTKSNTQCKNKKRPKVVSKTWKHEHFWGGGLTYGLFGYSCYNSRSISYCNTNKKLNQLVNITLFFIDNIDSVF